MNVAVASITALATLVAAVAGMLKYFNYRTTRDKQAAVGRAFSDVVQGLSSTDQIQRIASAILLRRFFDPTSEYGVAARLRSPRSKGYRATPYARDAIRVIAAVLREEPTGNLQKILADGLAHARTLEGADLQRTNLRDAYLGSDTEEDRVNLTGADFYRADLCGASLKRVTATRAQFFEARLVETVLSHADLRGANFYGADLRGCRFDDAQLLGAEFNSAQNVPPSIAAELDAAGRYDPHGDKARDDSPMSDHVKAARPVFVSMASVLPPPQRAVSELVVAELERCGASIRRIPRSSYSAAAPMTEISAKMRGCAGAVIIGLPQLVIATGRWREGTNEEADIKNLMLSTPWNQIEAGIAAALGIPLLVIRCETGGGGVFELVSEGHDFVLFDLTSDWDLEALRSTIESWVAELCS